MPETASTLSERHPVVSQHHLAKALHPTFSVLKDAMGDVDGFNAKFAVLITRLVGTMWCAYLFGLIALVGLAPALKPGGEGIVAWIAQTFLQLVLLSVIMVGQNVQSLASDARSANTYKDAEVILDRLDVHTQGGLKEILDRLNQIAPLPSTGSGSTDSKTPASEA
jgi:cobalamin biosynthesis protein CobD/CbiB